MEDAGALFVQGNSHVHLTNATFGDNYATYNGGAMFCTSGGTTKSAVVRFQAVEFYNNTVKGDKGEQIFNNPEYPCNFECLDDQDICASYSQFLPSVKKTVYIMGIQFMAAAVLVLGANFFCFNAMRVAAVKSSYKI